MANAPRSSAPDLDETAARPAEGDQQPSAEPADNAEEDAPEGEPLDLDSRLLCSDGACIGVIGDDAQCKECGKPYEGDVPAPAAPAPAVAAAADHRAAEAADDDGDDDGDDGDDGAAEWSDRELCSDGSCIGVIGANGRCKECGKSPEAAVAAAAAPAAD